MLRILFKKSAEAFMAVSPVAAVVLLLCLTPLLSLSGTEIAVFLASAFFLIVGISLFNLGADMAMTPMGEHVGAGLTKSKNAGLLLSVCFAMGMLITMAEPDLSMLVTQVRGAVDGTALILTVGVGVGFFLLLAVARILARRPLTSLLFFFYMVMFALAALLVVQGREGFLAVSFDAGGVTTGPVTVPFIMSLGVGIATVLGGRNDTENSFGLIALCSVGPVLAVMFLGLGAEGAPAYRLPIESYTLPSSFFASSARVLARTALDVVRALGMIALFFLLLQVFVLRLPRRRLRRMAVGLLYTFFGLVVFLCAAAVGFMPVGYAIGRALGEARPWVLVGFGFLLGALVVLAEPAVHVLNRQVEDVTGGTVTRRSMTAALSVGVGLSIALSLLRILLDFNLLYFLIPGYLFSLGLSFFVPPVYTAIAFDSGGVASGPLTSSFILPLAVGVCVVLHGQENILRDAFGIVSMVAMTPLITIQILGFRAVIARRLRDNIAMHRILSSDDEQIIRFN
ncbi:MAG: DUF1538 domain-containing protein [Clostridia bacterium]|nr:DUF1538 domain-containing protein [Clostridia bacterium]